MLYMQARRRVYGVGVGPLLRKSAEPFPLAVPIPEPFRDGRPVRPSCQQDEHVEDLMRGEEKVERPGRETLRTAFGIPADGNGRSVGQSSDRP